MSRVHLLAADRPLPLADCQEERIYRSASGVTLTMRGGFALRENVYYRAAVEELGYPMKPFSYTLETDGTEKDCPLLLGYLRENLASGESVELWSLWVGSGPGKLTRYQGKLSDFDTETFQQLFERDNLMETGQTCLTVTA